MLHYENVDIIHENEVGMPQTDSVQSLFVPLALVTPHTPSQ